MKSLLASVLLLAAFAPAFAQASDEEARETRERDRIRHEKATIEERFRVEEHACRQKFAVNDCVNKAKRSRSADLAELRKQELAINDAERKRRAEQRQKELAERQSAEHQQEAAEKRARALKESEERQKAFDEKAAKRAADQAGKAAHPPAPKVAKPGTVEPQGKPRASRAFKSPEVDASKAAQNRAKFESNQKEAAAHKAAVAERAAKRTKPPASALTVPKD
jgi:colicin import membrane protein